MYDGEVVFSGGEFEDSTSETFGESCGPLPTKSPSTPPTNTPSNGPTISPTSTPTDSCVSIQVDVLTDKYPEETSWTLTNTCTGDEVWIKERNEYTDKYTQYTETKCFEPGKYTFEIRDSWGDGICCDYEEGKYEVTYDGEVVASGGEFDDSESETFGGSCDAWRPVSRL